MKSILNSNVFCSILASAFLGGSCQSHKNVELQQVQVELTDKTIVIANLPKGWHEKARSGDVWIEVELVNEDKRTAKIRYDWNMRIVELEGEKLIKSIVNKTGGDVNIKGNDVKVPVNGSINFPLN